MIARTYSAEEVSSMRDAVKVITFRGNWREVDAIYDRNYYKANALVEERLVTYMAVGAEPDDLKHQADVILSRIKASEASNESRLWEVVPLAAGATALFLIMFIFR